MSEDYMFAECINLIPQENYYSRAAICIMFIYHPPLHF